jgi:choline dehydrogenase-like flavoprotein
MITTYPLRPRSKGQARIVSQDPSALPKLIYDPFANPDDCREMIGGVRFARKLASTKPLSDYMVEETRPGAHLQSDEEILGALQKWAGPGFHASGTCRMGSDSESVVDPKTCVRGVENLHVIDLSILPILTAGNTYAPASAIAWRAADLLLRQ